MSGNNEAKLFTGNLPIYSVIIKYERTDHHHEGFVSLGLQFMKLVRVFKYQDLMFGVTILLKSVRYTLVINAMLFC
jgi:hypothetical protein